MKMLRQDTSLKFTTYRKMTYRIQKTIITVLEEAQL